MRQSTNPGMHESRSPDNDRRVPVVLTFVSYYLPGYKSGGPVRSVANLVESCADRVEFRIVTLDRDAGDREAYPAITANTWNRVGHAQVYYASPGSMSLRGVVRLIRETRHDVLYLNSFFNVRFTAYPLLARRMGLVNSRHTILAPKGVFSPGAMGLKAWKKMPFLSLTRAIGLYRNLVWQASSVHEERDIRRLMGPGVDVQIAPDLPTLPAASTEPAGRSKQKGRVRAIFVSRITPKKNLDYALAILRKVHASVTFTIVGPVSDEGYWRRCRRVIEGLPEHVTVEHVGSVDHALIPQLLADSDLFFLPTKGENYGHVIAEALAAGTPVLISNTTPWRGLQGVRAGWDLSLDDDAGFVAAFEAVAAMDEEEFALWKESIREYARGVLADPATVNANLNLFCSPAGIVPAESKATE